MTLRDRLRRLQTDNTSGASALLERALQVLEAFADHPAFPDAPDIHSGLEALVRALVEAQPSMAPMIDLAQHVLQVCPDTLPEDAIPERLRHAAAAYRQHLQTSTAALCQHALRLIPPQATVLTYSNSTTVTAALQQARDHGRLQRVILSESRPACDGRPQALALHQHGIRVEFSIDMGLFERLPEAHVVLVGADAVFPHGLVNKLGTGALARMARVHDVPIFSLCARHKFLPAEATALWRVVDHPAAEVWPDAPPGLHIRNRYFETVPLDLFSGIVCEHTVYAPEDLRVHLQRQRLSPALRRLASGPTAGNDHGALAPDGASLERLEEP